MRAASIGSDAGKQFFEGLQGRGVSIAANSRDSDPAVGCSHTERRITIRS